jgi:hypothetical protein
MKPLLTILFFVFIPKLIFGQQLISENVNQKEEFKYEYQFKFKQPKNDKVINNTKYQYIAVYQINSLEKLTETKLKEIMACVKEAEENDQTNMPHKCSERGKYYITYPPD